MNEQTAKKEAARVTLVGMWLDLLLGAAKIIGGLNTASFALVTDGIHSLTDAISDVFVLIVSQFSHDAPDAEHPYGHGRFETIGTVVMGMFFFAISAVIIYDSYLRLRAPETISIPGWGGLIVAGISIMTKEWVYHYTMKTANRLNSSLLRANAWHSRSDAISSIAVLIGIAGALQGFPWLDVVAAIFVALLIARIGWELCLDSLKELVDTAIPVKKQKAIENTILENKGINRITSLRSRMSGGKILLEVQLQVNPRISVSEGHRLGEAVNKSITGGFNDIGDVIVHIDPEPHETHDINVLPLRDEIVRQIKEQWEDLLVDSEIRSIDLHYLDNGIEVDLYLHRDNLDDVNTDALASALRDIKYISRLKIYHTILEVNVAGKLS